MLFAKAGNGPSKHFRRTQLVIAVAITVAAGAALGCGDGVRIRIAIGTFQHNAHCLRLTEGIVREVRRLRERHPEHEIDLVEFRNFHRLYADVQDRSFDGAILYANQFPLLHGLAKANLPPFSELGIPWINTSNRYDDPPGARPVIRVTQDDFAVGNLVGRFFLERGFAHFAFVGFPGDFRFSRMRHEGFISGLGGGEVFTVPEGIIPAESNQHEQAPLADWLQTLPTGTAIFAVNDEVANRVLLSARDARIPVPQRLSVAGVDNSPEGNWARVGLTSVDLISARIGLDAARRLFRWIIEGEVPPAETRLDLARIVERTSTDHTAVDDRGIAKLLAHLRDHPEQPLTIQHMAKIAGMPRSTFHLRFQKQVGTGPQQYQLRLRLEKAKQLLLETDLPIAVVADLTGFGDLKWFYRAFNRHTGRPPGKWRRDPIGVS